MVKGLEKFKEYFAGFEDNYVIIGGTACDIALRSDRIVSAQSIVAGQFTTYKCRYSGIFGHYERDIRDQRKNLRGERIRNGNSKMSNGRYMDLLRPKRGRMFLEKCCIFFQNDFISVNLISFCVTGYIIPTIPCNRGLSHTAINS